MDSLQKFRAHKDSFFKSHPQSPLTEEQQETFEGLNYFPPNEAFRFYAELEKYPETPLVMLQTSTGGVQPYIRYGQLRLVIEDQAVSLTVFAEADNEEEAEAAEAFFLPFADALAGKETYGAGRYLEPQKQADGKLVVDFNLAYNPYCAYNERWSCPLTPAENRLKVAVPAGEKLFTKS